MEADNGANRAMMATEHSMEERDQHWNGATESLLATHYPLHRACRNGDIDTLTRLLSEQSPVPCLSEESFYGWTPFHWAAYFGKRTCLQKLFEHCAARWDGGRLDSDLRTSQFRQTPVHLAAFGGSVGCLRLLLELGCSPATKDYLGETAAHKAARSGSFECLSLLLTHGVNLAEENHAGLTAAAVAAKCGHTTSADFLRRSAELQSKAASTASTSASHSRSSFEQGGSNSTITTSMVNGAYGYVPVQLAQSANTGGTTRRIGDPSIPDVTLDADIGANRVSVAGRKRTYQTANSLAENEPHSFDLSAKKCRLNAFSNSIDGAAYFCQM
uniref:Ankyrin repeat domain-containing protein 10 n=1 Tax=Plectus sambesii TaxID=2011161 RepID=A0A914VTK3_9BILA